MTAHDPALVERLADAFWRDRAGIENVLDLLAAEGRLCAPGRIAKLRTRKAQLQGRVDWLETEVLAEVERLLSGWCYPLPVNALRVVRKALAEPSPELHSGAESPHVAPEVKPTDDQPLIDPDCRDGKHSSCVGDPCECDCHREAT